MGNGIEYGGAEEPTVEGTLTGTLEERQVFVVAHVSSSETEGSAKSPPSLPVSPIQKRKGRADSPKLNAARPRLVGESYNVMDFDSVEAHSSTRAPPTPHKPQLPVKPTVRIEPSAFATSERQKKPSRSHSKRSFLDQSIAAAQAVMASMGTSDQDGTEDLGPIVPARKKRLKVTSPTRK